MMMSMARCGPQQRWRRACRQVHVASMASCAVVVAVVAVVVVDTRERPVSVVDSKRSFPPRSHLGVGLGYQGVRG